MQNKRVLVILGSISCAAILALAFSNCGLHAAKPLTAGEIAALNVSENPIAIIPVVASIAVGGQMVFVVSRPEANQKFAIESGAGKIDADSGLFTADLNPGKTVITLSQDGNVIARSTVTTLAGAGTLMAAPSAINLLKGSSLTLQLSGPGPYRFTAISKDDPTIDIISVTDAGVVTGLKDGAGTLHVVDSRGEELNIPVGVYSHATKLYNAAGFYQFAVPPGVKAITVKAWGGGGGAGGDLGGQPGGNGGGACFTTQRLSVTGGEQLGVIVAPGGKGGGSNAISRSGGGTGAGLDSANGFLLYVHGGQGGAVGTAPITTSGGGGGGGGAASVIAKLDQSGLPLPLLVAGGGAGGGGAGAGSGGGNGGAAGEAGTGVGTLQGGAAAPSIAPGKASVAGEPGGSEYGPGGGGSGAGGISVLDQILGSGGGPGFSPPAKFVDPAHPDQGLIPGSADVGASGGGGGRCTGGAKYGAGPTPGAQDDPDRDTAGEGGTRAGHRDGNDGKVMISY